MISKYFFRHEFACHCGCGGDVVDAELLQVLEDVRNYFNKPTRILSGYRCTSRNEKAGGAKNSQHLLGKAADIEVSGVPHAEVQLYLKRKYPETYGIGSYSTFTHIDVRRDKARW
jgi:uncharacterized protein YcbK (DUF882 family)